MKKMIFTLLSLATFAVTATADNTETTDTVKVHYIHTPSYDGSVANTIYVNEEVTTHVIMPENIKLVDISTAKIVGNQCADNIVRLKPSGRMIDKELAGTITIIGERHIAQFKVVYTKGPAKANSVYNITQDDMRQYTNPDVSMTQGDMARLSWSIFTSRRNKYGIRSTLYGIKARVNNIYTVGDYFFIDFSLKNCSKIKYDIAEIRLKLMDKKELKATNSQTIELTPVYMINHDKSFQKEYRNVIVLKKLTFPNEKKLRLEISEDQISGRVSYIDINYRDILNADSFSSDLLMNLH